MIFLIVRVMITAALVAAVAIIAKRSPAAGALVASLPLVSVLGMIWLWHDTHDAKRLAVHAEATFWYVVPSLPMFLLMPAMLRAGHGFWLALGAGIALTAVLYLITAATLARFGIHL